MEFICTRCGQKKGNKKPVHATYHIGRCSYCGEKTYVTEPRDFGIYDEPDEDVKKLMNLFNIKL